MKKLRLFFKKLNLFDYFLAILFVVGISFYFLYFKRADNMIYVDVFSPSPEWTEDSYPVSRWQASALKKGEAQYNSFGQKIAEVIDVYRTPWNGGKQEYMFATLKIKATYNKNMKTYSFNGNPLLFGTNFLLEANNSSLEGKIINIYKTPEEKNANFKQKKILLTVKYRSQEPWIAEKLLKKTELRDSSQKLMFSIVDVKISLAKEFYPNWQGQMMTSIHPEKKDIIVKIEIPEAECSDYSCFYNHYFPLSVGWDFPLDFGDLVMTYGSTITDVQYND
jgi:hypothetical protein